MEIEIINGDLVSFSPTVRNKLECSSLAIFFLASRIMLEVGHLKLIYFVGSDLEKSARSKHSLIQHKMLKTYILR
jgi:hypothetical protein